MNEFSDRNFYNLPTNGNFCTPCEFHKKDNFDITLVASAKEYIIQYGNCVLNEDGHLSHIDEKPKYDYLINTGLYVLNPDVLGYIPKNKFLKLRNNLLVC